jgi:hypothetical protein
MSPHSLLDTSRLLNRVAAQIAPDSSLAVEKSSAGEGGAIARIAVRHANRLVQAGALLCGTLLFLPFLIGYFVACSGQ